MGANSKTAAVSGGVSAGYKTEKKGVNRVSLAQGALVADERHERMKLYAWTAGTTAVMVAIMFMSRGIYPFGESVLRYTADGGQYFGLLGSLQRALLTDDNILFSWSTVLGGNMMGIFAYYAASPFNLLTVFFPDNLMAAYHVIFALKFVSAAVCFAVMLRNIFPDSDRNAILLFAVSYPFIGFTTYYAWNQSWLDGVMLLPLVLLGIWQIVHQRRPLLYTVALALILLANYYIGYIICLGSALLFVTVLILFHPKRTSDTVKTCVWYITATAMAAALVAFLLLPTYYALPDNRSISMGDLIDDIAYRSMPEETLSMLYTAPYENMKWKDNYPVIFTGIVQLVLVVLFFLNDEIGQRYKVAAAVLLAVFAVSFAISLLDTIWHGMSKTMWFNHRYSFLMAFVLEIISFISFVHVRGSTTKLLLAAGVLAGITLIALSAEKKNIGPRTLLLDVIMIGAVLVLLYAYSRAQGANNRNRRGVLFAAIAGVAACNLLVNSYLSLGRIGEGDTISSYRDAVTTDQIISDVIDDDGFYRMASTWRYGACDPARVGFAGVENFASPENPEVIDAAARLGLRAREWRSYYGDNVPLSTDALLGLRYIVTGNQHKADRYKELGQVPDAYLYVYKNPNALPLLFPGESLYNTPDDAELNKFEYMNAYWNSISTEGGDIFEAVEVSREDSTTKEGYDMQFSFTAPQDGPVYARIPRGDVTVDSPVEPRQDHQDVYYVGEYSAGEQGELTAHAKEGYDPGSDIVFYSENTDALATKSAEVLSGDVQIDKVSGSELLVRYTAKVDGFLTSTVPFDEGWHVYVDGTEVETYRNMDTFLTFDVPQGEHEIKLVYWPPYFGLGVGISITAVAAVAAYAYLGHRKQCASGISSGAAGKQQARKKHGQLAAKAGVEHA